MADDSDSDRNDEVELPDRVVDRKNYDYRTIRRKNKKGTTQLGDRIGKGAFGKVFKGLNVETGTFVAVKRLNRQKIDEEKLMSEVNLLKTFQNENIVRYYNLLRSENSLNLILEYVEGGSLAQVLTRFGVFPEQLASIYTVQILRGLDYLHHKGVIHRDIKGSNVLITKEGTIKLADFGIAIISKVSMPGDAAAGSGGNLDGSGGNQAEWCAVEGSPFWMAPEVIEMQKPNTTACDIWSLGCTIIELVTGFPPYFDSPAMTALFKMVSEPRPPLPDDISDELSDFLLQCFQREPKDRPTAEKLMEHAWVKKKDKSGAAEKLDINNLQKSVKLHNTKGREKMQRQLLKGIEWTGTGSGSSDVPADLRSLAEDVRLQQPNSARDDETSSSSGSTTPKGGGGGGGGGAATTLKEKAEKERKIEKRASMPPSTSHQQHQHRHHRSDRSKDDERAPAPTRTSGGGVASSSIVAGGGRVERERSDGQSNTSASISSIPISSSSGGGGGGGGGSIDRKGLSTSATSSTSSGLSGRKVSSGTPSSRDDDSSERSGGREVAGNLRDKTRSGEPSPRDPTTTPSSTTGRGGGTLGSSSSSASSPSSTLSSVSASDAGKKPERPDRPDRPKKQVQIRVSTGVEESAPVGHRRSPSAGPAISVTKSAAAAPHSSEERDGAGGGRRGSFSQTDSAPTLTTEKRHQSRSSDTDVMASASVTPVAREKLREQLGEALRLDSPASGSSSASSSARGANEDRSPAAAADDLRLSIVGHEKRSNILFNYTLYKILVVQKGKDRAIFKTHGDFKELHAKLEKSFTLVPELPSRKMGNSPEIVNAQILALNKYLDRLTKMPSIVRSELFDQFIRSSSH